MLCHCVIDPETESFLPLLLTTIQAVLNCLQARFFSFLKFVFEGQLGLCISVDRAGPEGDLSAGDKTSQVN